MTLFATPLLLISSFDQLNNDVSLSDGCHIAMLFFSSYSSAWRALLAKTSRERIDMDLRKLDI